MTDLQARIDANWRAISFELDAPVPSRTERVLRRVGFSSATARLVAATPALRRSWASALIAVVMIGIVAAGNDPSNITAMLVLAPLVPVFGVALAYGPAVDPIHELSLATPMRGLRVLSIRAATVLTVAVTVLAGTVVLTAASNSLAFVWLLPALALTSLTVALMTAITPRRAVATVAAGWLTLVLVVQAVSTSAMTVFSPAVQISSLAVLAVGGFLITKRRDRFDRVAP